MALPSFPSQRRPDTECDEGGRLSKRRPASTDSRPCGATGLHQVVCHRRPGCFVSHGCPSLAKKGHEGQGALAHPLYWTGRWHCSVDVVELEPAVVHAAKEGMGFREWPNLRVFLEDGVTFAQRKVQEGATDVGVYDAVLVDAYDPDGNVPEALWNRGEGLVEALSDGLLRRCGVVATNFLPHVDLAAPLAAYSGALSSHGSGRSFSIQVNKPVDPENDLEKIFDVEGTGNRIAVHICGAPPELADGPLPVLEDRLKQEAKKVGMATGCVWDMPDLACRGLRDWPAVQAADEVKIFSM